MLKIITKMVNSLVGYTALLRRPAFPCKGWVDDRSIFASEYEFSKFRAADMFQTLSSHQYQA